MRARRNNPLTPSGRLRRAYRPAIYLDSSVLVEYWLADGLECGPRELPYPDPEGDLLRSILRADKNTSLMGQIREAATARPPVCLVASSLAVLELVEWHAHAAIGRMLAEAAGIAAIQKQSRKQVGDLLKQLSAKERRQRRSKRAMTGQRTPIESIVGGAWLDPSFTGVHGLWGVLQVSLLGFDMSLSSAWGRFAEMAYLQIGLADMLHVAAAHHLGCEYFASFDSDFTRVKADLKRTFGLKLLPSRQDLLQVLTKKC